MDQTLPITARHSMNQGYRSHKIFDSHLWLHVQTHILYIRNNLMAPNYFPFSVRHICYSYIGKQSKAQSSLGRFFQHKNQVFLTQPQQINIFQRIFDVTVRVYSLIQPHRVSIDILSQRHNHSSRTGYSAIKNREDRRSLPAFIELLCFIFC